MERILITGNGFDLNLGLPTKYDDFINILKYLENKSEFDFHKIYSRISTYSLIHEKYNAFEIDENKAKELVNAATTNLWYLLFKNETQIETWIDFEKKIEQVINIISTSAQQLNEKVFSIGPRRLQDNKYKGTVFSNDIVKIKILESFNLLIEDLIIKDLYSINENFLIIKHERFVNFNIEKVARMLDIQLRLFKQILNDYFVIFIFPFYSNAKSQIETDSYKKITRHYTFNYTPTFENFIKSGLTKYLHGKIDLHKNNIVLGINEIPEEVNEKREFIPFTKYFQKLNQHTEYLFIKEFENKLESDYCFYFFGHSLDRSDENYVNEVFDFIKNLKTGKGKIVIISHSEESEEFLLTNLLVIRGRNEIEDLMKKKELVFVRTDSEELKKELSFKFPSISIPITSVVR